ncbi:hypothetical protein D515_01394 [Grimontia indica]|uniref:DUF2783 domain-containing protein n=1 Tax=Grimontia indica TaxID=1056512 RepID=R1IWE4_9GAMM|nr:MULTISPECIES: DUF2783 domain-containing protein [Grimontia]EOD79600.1 hypothetical protein D515_01394 [Grimontia indica]WRV99762.1 DUF2783 domain-containing protein [Grimontia sp. NTOU-MAR1]
MKLNIEPNFTDGDAFYAALANIYNSLPPEEVMTVNAKLVLLLANHIGEQEILEQAIVAATQ